MFPRLKRRYEEATLRAAKTVRTACLRTGLGLGLILLATWASALSPDIGINGVWMTEHADAKIRIAACAQTLCGTIIWLAEPHDASGRPRTDVNNSDETKRARPLIGLTIFTDLTPDGDEWRGHVYNADTGKDYDVGIRLIDEQHASVKGCIVEGLLCGGETWTRN